MNEFLILLQAKLDEAKSKGNVNADIKELQNRLDKLKVQVEIDPNSANKLADSIGKLINQKIIISNIGINQTQVAKTGQQIGKVISDSAEKAVSNVSSESIGKYFRIDSSTSNQFRSEMERLVKEWTNTKGKLTDVNIQTRTSYDEKEARNIERLHQATVTYKNELDEVIKKTIAWRQIGTTTNDKGEEVAIRGFVEVAGQYSKSLDTVNAKTDSFVEKQKKAVVSAQNTLSTIESKLNDPNISKSLSGTDFDTNGLNTQLERVKSAISVLGNVSRDTFTQAQIDVNKEITSLNNLISTLKNAEYAATSLRTKDINTIKIDERNNLNTFVQKMEQSGHYTDELKQKVENLRTQLNGVFDANTLTSYLNGLSNLQSEFKSVDATAKTLEKSTKLQTNIEAEKKILQVYTNELKTAGVLTDDVKEKIQNMFYSLSKVDSQNGLTTWRAELKGVKAETDAVLKSVQKTTDNSNLEKLNADIKTLVNSLNNFSSKNAGFNTFKIDINGVEVSLDSLIQKLSTVNNASDLGIIRSQAEALKTSFSQLQEVNKIQLSMETGGYDAKVDTLIAKTRQWTDSEGQARISTNELSAALKNLNDTSNALSNNNTVANQNALIAAEKELDVQIKIVTNSVRKMNAEFATDSKVVSLHNRVADFMSKNGKTVKYFGTELNDIFNQTLQGAKLTNEELTILKQRFIDVQNTARATGKLGNTFFQTIRKGMSSFSYWTSSTFIVMKTIHSIKKGISTIKELDTALVDLKKTTSMTNSELESFYYKSNEIAKQSGVTTAEIINQAAAWSRLGYSSSEAAIKMAKYSSMFASISPGMNVDTATDGLVSIMKAFDIGNDNPDDVLDGIMSKVNIIGNTAATSNAEIVNMLTKSSSAMKEANNTLEETIALETAAVEITRDDDSVGMYLPTNIAICY